jgi:hypothetical protein
MRETLETMPERFGLFNNGITIVVSQFHKKEESLIELVEPSIVNGCQTTRTIFGQLTRTPNLLPPPKHGPLEAAVCERDEGVFADQGVH